MSEAAVERAAERDEGDAPAAPPVDRSPRPPVAGRCRSPVRRAVGWLDAADPARRARRAARVVACLVFVIGWPRLPTGIYVCDPGDFQIACATLGIAHSPGYVGYAAVGWLLTKLFFFFPPTYVVSMACLACMALALGLLAAILVRVGVSAWLAAALALLAVNHDSVWYSMNVPEVYAPSLALLAAVLYAAVAYRDNAKLGWLVLAGTLFGYLVANRAPAILYAPGLFIGLWLVERNRRRSTTANDAGDDARRTIPRRFPCFGSRVALVLGCAAVALAGVMALTWLRDTPANPYNHVQRYAEVYNEPTAQNETLGDRWRRFAWLVTGQEFNKYKGADTGQMNSKFRWIRRQLGVYDRTPFLVLLGVLGVGGAALTRSRPELVIALAFVILGTIGFQVQYRVHDQAADLLPVIFACLLLGGVAATRILPTFFARGRKLGPVIAFLVVASVTASHGATRYDFAEVRQAAPFLEELQWETLPPDAVMISYWTNTRPLWYKQVVEKSQPGITIISCNDSDQWARFVAPYLNERPVFYLSEAPAPGGYRLEAWRNAYRLVALSHTGFPHTHGL